MCQNVHEVCDINDMYYKIDSQHKRIIAKDYVWKANWIRCTVHTFHGF